VNKKGLWIAEVLIVISWAFLFNEVARYVRPESWFVELTASIAGISVGVVTAWGIRFFASRLKAERAGK